MKILYFAWLRTQIGSPEEDVTPPPEVNTLYGLIDWLKAKGEPYQSALSDLSVVRIAVNQEYVTEDIPLNGTEEVAFFPPVTGG
ncbi:molybdopterin converting factor subunit 1 [Sneathiella limimaris]|uniref:molybdopterin converting factor subunit 1 n=1 Tax=Sneathiella limimaris TaxID=1964213 RepID=UPI00146F154D|nr:molybdopterin converting factor subunit 1 [Sneathiella limimaris]